MSDHAKVISKALDERFRNRMPDGDTTEWDTYAALDALVAERDEALSHCRGPMPSPERMAETHSRLPAQWFASGYARLANHGVGHYAYQQGPETCYICTLLGLLSAAEARVAELEKALREATDWIEEEEPYEDPHDVVRLNLIAGFRTLAGGEGEG